MSLDRIRRILGLFVALAAVVGTVPPANAETVDKDQLNLVEEAAPGADVATDDNTADIRYGRYYGRYYRPYYGGYYRYYRPYYSTYYRPYYGYYRPYYRPYYRTYYRPYYRWDSNRNN